MAVDENKDCWNKRKKSKDLLAAVPGGYFKYEAKRRGQFTLSAPSCYGLLGYTEAEFRKKFNNCFDDMVYKEDREKGFTIH